MTAARIARGLIGLVGTLVLAIGVRGVWVHRVDTRPFLGPKDLPAFWLGGALLHDLMVVPVAIVIALLVRKLVGPPWRSWVLSALVVSAGVTVVAWPALRGYGRRPDNRTILPRDYVAGWVRLLALIWAMALVGSMVTAFRARAHIDPKAEEG